MRPLLCAAVAALALGGWPTCPAAAHGTGARSLGGGAIAVELYYSDGDPMAFAEAKVYGPGDDDNPFQNGRADRRGRVAFLPDRDGAWRIEAVDGEGHRIAMTLAIAAGTAAAAPAAGASRWLVWASLTLNLFAAATLWAGRRRPAPPGGPRPRAAVD